MKTFKDLEFKKHNLADISPSFKDAKQSVMNFSNGYGVSVLLGLAFYSNGVDTYEVAILKDGDVCYETPITDDVLSNQTEEEVTEVMERLQCY